MPSLSRVTGILIRVIAISLVLIPPCAFAQPITFDWSRRFGGTLDDGNRAVAVDAQGNVLVTGTFRGTVNFGGVPIISQGSSDIFLLKLDAEGNFVFAAGFGSTGLDAGIGVGADDSGNIYLTGTFSGNVGFGNGTLASSGASDIFLASFDADGAHRWSKRFGSTGTEGVGDLAAAPNGDLIIVGWFVGTIDFGGAPLVTSAFCPSAFVARFDNSGNHDWSLDRYGQCINGFTVDYYAEAVALGPTGNCCVALYREVCTNDCNSFGMVEDFDASGSSLGAFSPDGGFPVRDVAIDADGNIYSTVAHVGFDEQPYKVMAKNSPDHTRLWKQEYLPPLLGLHIDAISVDANGHVLGLGKFQGTVDFGDGPMTSVGNYDIFALKLPPAGEPPRSQRIGGAGLEQSRSAASAGPGAYIVAGEFTGTTDVAGQPLSSAGGIDVLVAKIRFPTEIAVAIAEFQAKSENGVVVLKSRFRSNLGVVAVNVYRSSAPTTSSMSRIASVAGDGSKRFHFVDHDVEPGKAYRYQIGVVDADGEFFSVVATVSVDPIYLELSQNRPNPFNPTTTIRFVLPKTERVVISIFDGNGRHVRALLDGVRSHGSHEITWDGRDDVGAPVSSGVYFYRLDAGKFKESRKMVLLK